MTLDNMTGITKVSYTGGDLFCKSQLITCNRVKECNGVCPFEDALKYADKMQTMNEQHTVDHGRDWIIGCIQHDGFIHTDRFDKANQIILDALSVEAVQGWIPCSERLPDVGREVLASGYYDDVYIATLKEDKREEYYWSAFGGFPVMFSAVDAWMPLPTPYKGGDDE